MPEIAYQAAQKRVMVVEELMEMWKKDHEFAMMARDIEQIIQEAAELRDPIKRLIMLFMRGPQPATLNVDWTLAHDSGSLLNKAIEMFEDFSAMIERIQGLGYTLDNLESFEVAKNEMLRLRQDFSRIWSLPDDNAENRACKAITAGNYSIL